MVTCHDVMEAVLAEPFRPLRIRIAGEWGGRDLDLLRQRLAKEAVHEVGHTLDLTHCEDYQCAMAPSHAVEWIDLKESALCEACQARIFVG